MVKVTRRSGMQYKMLALDSSRSMTLKVANKILELVKAGAVITTGPRPTGTPSLSDDSAAYNTVINELWGNNDGNMKQVGSGKVYTGQDMKSVLDLLNVKPDFQYPKTQPGEQLLYVHRTLPDQDIDIYWVNNRKDEVQNLDATFRVADKNVEIWHPQTGKVEQASYSFKDGLTKVPLHLKPNDAIFILFKENTTKAVRAVSQPIETKLAVLEGKWDINFQKKRGAPASIVVNKLESLTDNKDAGVKYFSGTATYSKSFDAPATWLKKGAKQWIDLGDVKNIAEVNVNGKSLAPSGKNHLS